MNCILLFHSTWIFLRCYSNQNEDCFHMICTQSWIPYCDNQNHLTKLKRSCQVFTCKPAPGSNYSEFIEHRGLILKEQIGKSQDFYLNFHPILTELTWKVKMVPTQKLFYSKCHDVKNSKPIFMWNST